MGISKPWQDANPEIKKGLNFRMSEPQYEKLLFLHYATRVSMQKILEHFVWNGVEKAIVDIENGCYGSMVLEEGQP